MGIESLSANSCFSLHLVAVGFAAVAEIERKQRPVEKMMSFGERRSDL